jgi:vanillate O-demethylase monooxygenase subunit
MFVRNCWYVAAWSDELGSELLRRDILNEPVLLYRTPEGAPVALSDRCAHRRYPLSRGRLCGDAVECGYHGFTYAPDGACVRIPGQDHVPARARVHSYPVVERWRWVWIWPGDPSRADESLIPDHTDWLKVTDPDWHAITGSRLHLEGRYSLMNENLLDLSHLSFIHATNLGTEEVAETPLETDVDERSVRVLRDMRGVKCPPFYQKTMGLETPVDRRQVAEFMPPSYHISHLRAAPAGGGDADAFCHRVLHMLTPETTSSAHYFWAISRTYAKGEEWVDTALRDSLMQVFEQDLEAIKAQEEMIATDRSDASEVSVKLDAGSLQGRRLVQQMLDRDAERVRPPTKA